jgi:hypothetical protein
MTLAGLGNVSQALHLLLHVVRRSFVPRWPEKQQIPLKFNATCATILLLSRDFIHIDRSVTRAPGFKHAVYRNQGSVWYMQAGQVEAVRLVGRDESR